jgi:hypothetical protein
MSIMHIIASWHRQKINYKKISKIQIQFVLPYPLNLSPIDYHLFEHPDNFLREKVFQIESEKFNESLASHSFNSYVKSIDMFTYHVE